MRVSQELSCLATLFQLKGQNGEVLTASALRGLAADFDRMSADVRSLEIISKKEGGIIAALEKQARTHTQRIEHSAVIPFPKRA